MIHVAIHGSDVVACSHCGETLARIGADDRLGLIRIDAEPTAAGPQITAVASDYVDGEVVFRRYCCPNCWTTSWSGLVPIGHPDYALELGMLEPTVA